MAKGFDENPHSSIRQIFEKWSDTKAIYRFFDNDIVTSEAILYPHIQKTIERIHNQGVVLVIQDTCFFTYGHHKKTQGLGKITGPTKKYGRMFENSGVIMLRGMKFCSSIHRPNKPK